MIFIQKTMKLFEESERHVRKHREREGQTKKMQV